MSSEEKQAVQQHILAIDKFRITMSGWLAAGTLISVCTIVASAVILYTNIKEQIHFAQKDVITIQDQQKKQDDRIQSLEQYTYKNLPFNHK